MRCRRSAVVLSTDSRDPSSAGLFGIFCSLILASQIHLILLNQTTVESLNFRSMRDREQELLSHTHGWYQCWCVVFIPGPPARCVCDDLTGLSVQSGTRGSSGTANGGVSAPKAISGGWEVAAITGWR